MKIFIATDISIAECQGRLYARGKYFTILRRYYNAFGPIVLFSRFFDLEKVTDEYEDITDLVVDTVKIRSLSKALVGAYTKEIIIAMKDCDIAFVRCPSISAYKAAAVAKKLKKPYFAEAMGCPWDAYWNHGVVGKAIAPYMFFKMRNVLKNADYALYVTKEFLQRRYPCKNETVGVSDVVISSNEYVLNKRIEKIGEANKNEITLMTTAGVNVKYKGQQYVIAAIPALNRAGIRVKYLIVGEGDQTYLRSVAKKHDVEDQVVFTGPQPLSEVFNLLDECDIYVQPSLQEGLPRAVVEAMGRGCPCIGARTGGIPELLEERFVVKRKSISDIERSILAFCKLSAEEKVAVARRNYDKADEFNLKDLDELREGYYNKVKKEVF